jgi:hypothetical protein
LLSKSNISRFVTVALLVGAASSLGVAQTAPGRDALNSLGLRSDSNGYSELSFARPTDLPSHIPGDGSPLAMPFLVRNVESRPRTYQWVVEQRSAGHTQRIASGTTPEVGVGRSAYISPAIGPSCAKGRILTTVRIKGLGQSIDFWTRCSNGATA